MNILLLKKKGVRVNSFAFIISVRVNTCKLQTPNKTDFIHKLCIVQKNVMINVLARTIKSKVIFLKII
jgi:hypothetical protein